MQEEKDCFGIIYKITFPNNKMYIGQTQKTLEQRKKNHKTSSKESNIVIYKAIRKYGWNNLKWDIIDTARNIDELNKKEIYWIETLRTYLGFKDCKGYNSTLGGEGFYRLTEWTQTELHQLGIDFKNGMSRDEIQIKYNIKNRQTLNLICSGKLWKEFTKIDTSKYTKYNFSSIFTPENIDFILTDFKKHGDTRRLANMFNCIYPSIIRNILIGKTWSDYTHIKDDSFYNKYVKVSNLFTRKELQEIGEMKKNGKSFEDFKSKFPHIKNFTLRNIWRGDQLSNYTGIIKELNSNKTPRGARIDYKIVDKIIELYNQGLNNKEISELLHLHKDCVRRIITGETWSSYTKIIPKNKK